MSKTFYFAYGSNCNTIQMAHRCPEAVDHGAVILSEHQLEFRYYANIRPQAGASVEGVLWEITKDCERSLDRYEGFPNSYTKEMVTVTDEHGDRHEVMVYVMTPNADRPIRPPASDYYNGITEGLRSHQIGTTAVVEARTEALEHDGKQHVVPLKKKKGTKLKLVENRATIRAYIDESLLSDVDDHVHQKKKKEKGYSRSDLINEALRDYMKKQEGENKNGFE